MRQSDAGDFQIHRPDADALTTEVNETVGTLGVPREDPPRGEEIEVTLQTVVSNDLVMWIGEAMDFREPAPQLFFYGHDGGDGIIS